MYACTVKLLNMYIYAPVFILTQVRSGVAKITLRYLLSKYIEMND